MEPTNNLRDSENEAVEPTHMAPQPFSGVSKGLSKKRHSTKSLLVTALAAAFLVVLLSSAGMAAAFLVGRQSASNNLENQRQTVVQEGEVIADVAQRLSPSVVSILTQQQATINSQFFGPRTQTSQAAGTGLIIDQEGLILTNKHVVPTTTNQVQIVTADGERYDEVRVVGRDPLNDLAILKVENPKDFVAARLGDSDKVRTGQKVIAIGNALGQFQNTVTSGIISGQGRPIEASDESGASSEQLSNLFQTDAAINSGNSGGPLLNFNGEVIGINTAVAAEAENIGFAIPINETKGIINSVKTTGKLSRPYIGVQHVMLTPAIARELELSVEEGAYISTDEGSVVNGSPADRAGLRGGDVITRVNNVRLGEAVPLVSAIGRYKVGDEVELTVLRDSRERKVTIRLAEAPNS